MATERLSTKGVDLSGYPSADTVRDDDLAAALWVLWVARDSMDRNTLSPAEIAMVCRDELHINLTRQKVEGILKGKRELIARRKVEGRWRYQIMQAGVDYVSKAGAGVLFVAPEQALTQIRAVQDLLGSLEGLLRVCDPYLSPRSLDFIVQCAKASELRVLTAQVRTKASFLADLKAARSELGVPIEIRVATSGVLHDRYVIHDNGMVLLGTSLNGLGNKQSVVVALGPDVRSMAMRTFDQMWVGSDAL